MLTVVERKQPTPDEHHFITPSSLTWGCSPDGNHARNNPHTIHFGCDFSISLASSPAVACRRLWIALSARRMRRAPQPCGKSGDSLARPGESPCPCSPSSGPSPHVAIAVGDDAPRLCLEQPNIRIGRAAESCRHPRCFCRHQGHRRSDRATMVRSSCKLIQVCRAMTIPPDRWATRSPSSAPQRLSEGSASGFARQALGRQHPIAPSRSPLVTQR